MLNLFQMDPSYVPGSLETRQVYGVSMQQNRNDAKIEPSLFTNIVSMNKDVSILYIDMSFVSWS